MTSGCVDVKEMRCLALFGCFAFSCGSHGDAGDYAKALELNVKVLALRKENLGEDHPDTLSSMANLAVWWVNCSLEKRKWGAKQRGDNAQEKKTHKQKKGGSSGLHRVFVLFPPPSSCSFAHVGEHVKALELEEKMLKLRQAKLGAEHPDTIASMVDLATRFAFLRKGGRE
jgi:hypothetical protein